ncbi:MAG: arsenite methyltransferase, partial [Ethanoligenens sp.]
MESQVHSKVQEYYGGIAKSITEGQNKSCCGCGSTGNQSCCDGISSSAVIYNGENLSDLPKEAVDASLGCANPLVFARLEKGETVLDLGSGGGINVLMAAKHVGETGKVYGLDMTDEMLALARSNQEKMGVKNVEFIKGFIEDIPLKNEAMDVIISNCVINLSDDKPKAISEAYRVLKKGGRIAIADIVNLKPVSADIKSQTDLWCGCIGGTLELQEYRSILEKAGFHDIEINPAHVYTREVIEQLFGNSPEYKTSGVDMDKVDGAFAGAYIK